MNILDRTLSPLPLVIDADTDLSDVFLVDNNLTRPAVILFGNPLKLGGCYRNWNVHQSLTTDPSLSVYYNGSSKTRPTLKITTSHHDHARAFVVAFGSFSFETETMVCPLAVLALAEPDGAYGKNSSVKIGNISNQRGGVWASGQENLSVCIGDSNAACWPNFEGDRGHGIFYGNESRTIPSGLGQGLLLPVHGIKIRVGTSRGFGVVPGVRFDNFSIKFKASTGIDAECIDDANPGGAFDCFGGSGVIRWDYTHPGGDCGNDVASAFRCGGNFDNKTPIGKLCVMGTFNVTKAPDPTKPVGQLETQWAAFAECKTIGGMPVNAWPGTDTKGLTYSVTEV